MVECMKVSLRMIYVMEKDVSSITAQSFLKENGRRIFDMDMVSNSSINLSMKVIIGKAINMDEGYSNVLMVKTFMKVNGDLIRSMDKAFFIPKEMSIKVVLLMTYVKEKAFRAMIMLSFMKVGLLLENVMVMAYSIVTKNAGWRVSLRRENYMESVRFMMKKVD